MGEVPWSEGDVLVCFASWDARCTGITYGEVPPVRVAALISFVNKGQSGRASDNGRLLREWMNKAGVEIREATIDSLDERQAFSELSEVIEQISIERRRPLRVIVDLSAGPKAYCLGMIAHLLKTQTAYEILAFYAEPDYELRKDREVRVDAQNHLVALDTRRYEYTEGDWRPIPMPYLEGEFLSGRRKRVIASLGFESVPSYHLVAQYEPDELIPIVAEPGFTPEYTQLAHEANDRLIASFGVSAEEVLRFAAGDVGAIFEGIIELERRKQKAGVDVAFLCFGLKTHALGLALAAIVLDYPVVVGRVPRRFLERDTKCGTHCWVYNIRDSSAVVRNPGPIIT